MMEETIDNMKPVGNSSATDKSAIQSDPSSIKWKSVPYQVASRTSTFIVSRISAIYPLLTRFLTFVMSIELTVQWYYNFMHEQFVTKAFAYTLPFICVIVLVSDLVIDDKESEEDE